MAARKASNVFIPDVNYLPELYQRLGVTDLKTSGLTTADYLSAWSGVNTLIINDWIVLVGLQKEPIGITWIDPQFEDRKTDKILHVWYLERLPEIVLKRLEVRIENLKEAGGGTAPLSSVPRDILQKITNPALKGKDLIGLCIQNAAANRYCNQNDQQLFKDRLFSEFGLNWKLEKQEFATPRELYIQMHKKYWEIAHQTEHPELHARYGKYNLIHVPRQSSRGKDTVLRIVPDPSWPKQASSYLFFFPDEVSLSYIRHAGHREELISYQRTNRIKLFLSDKQIDEFSKEYMQKLSHQVGGTFFGRNFFDIPSNGKWGDFIAQIVDEDEDEGATDRVYIFRLD